MSRATSVVCPGCQRRINLRWDGTLQAHRRKGHGGYAPWCEFSSKPPTPKVEVDARTHARDLARARGDQGQTAVTSC